MKLRPAPALGQTSLLMDLRPCYEGFAGIPQEARLLFALFAEMGLGRLGGLASGIHFAARPPRKRKQVTPLEETLDQTEMLITQDTKLHYTPRGMANVLPGILRRRIDKVYSLLAYAGRSEQLAMRIDPAVFDDYLWVRLFERTLPPSARALLHNAEFFPTVLGHENARQLAFMPRPFQRGVATRGWDAFFGFTVSPYRVTPGTAMMIRYYDALPLLSPHTIGEPMAHATSHARMMQRNMEQGAHFYCDSEPVRGDLLRLFPQAEKRVHTIPCFVAPEYVPEVLPQVELKAVLRRRASPATAQGGGLGGAPPVDENATLPRLVMAVSTLEPRKNYLRLFRAFEMARRRAVRPMQLLIVANTGWRSEKELAELKMLVREGAYHLTDVPLPELRLLYSMAHLVVAPSRAEGFDYSGVEAMACGTPVLASDIPVHRWVYGGAAEYFDPYDTDDLARVLAGLADLPRESGKLADMRDDGLRRAALYRPSALSRRWEQAVLDVTGRKPAAGAIEAERAAPLLAAQ